MRVYLHSIGCRLNQSEIETMARQLIAAGHEIVADSAQADKVIVNSCAVTKEAARDARNVARRIHRQNRGAELLLTGCYATIAPEDVEKLPGVTEVVSNERKDRIVAMIDPRASTTREDFDLEPILRDVLENGHGRTRAFVKVQDGCDNRCTFCVTTIARGAGKSRRLGDVVAEIQAMTQAGYQEAVLTGVHLGSYGRDLNRESVSPVRLHDLVAAILNHTDIPRLRLSSLEPWDITPDFFELWRDPRLLPHLHLPLQSGSDRLLRSMARRTTRAAFRQLANSARETIVDLNLTTDIIVGFPGESEYEFEESLDYVREIGFSRLHVFSYSSRPGTAAARMPNHVPKRVKKERVQRMVELGRDLSQEYHQRSVGQTREVLWETNYGVESGDGSLMWSGYTDNYVRVSARSTADLFNKITPTRLVSAREDGLVGKIVSKD